MSGARLAGQDLGPAAGHARRAAEAGARPWVVKIGGRLCEQPEDRERLARACAALARPLVLVHGGGDAVTRIQALLGMLPRFESGRRVTSDAEMAVVEMVLSGSVNPALVRALRAAGRQAAGVSGADAAMIVCRIVPELGRVGVPEHVDPSLLLLLLGAGITPVVSPVSLDAGGRPLNVNADEAAAAIAAALRAERLLLVSDVDGVQVGEATSQDLAAADVEPLIARGTATRGMIPKLRAAARAAAHGVDEVRIGGFNAALDAITGTRVHAPACGASGYSEEVRP